MPTLRAWTIRSSPPTAWRCISSIGRANDPARGTVLIVHGLGEHIGRYATLAGRLNAWGWHVVGHDQRGHGRSDGARGAIARGDALLHDLALVIDAVRAGLPAPLVLLGHSLGGLVAARFVAGRHARRRARRRMVSRCRSAGVVVARVRPGHDARRSDCCWRCSRRWRRMCAVSNGLKPEWISRDSAVVEAYRTDPMVHERVTPRLVRFIVDAAALVARACRRVARAHAC